MRRGPSSTGKTLIKDCCAYFSGLRCADAIIHAPALLGPGATCLIRTVDSMRFESTAEVSDVFRRMPAGATVTPMGLICRVASLLSPLGELSAFFHGFDEFWIWRTASDVKPPPDVVLTAEHVILDRMIDVCSASTWMHQTGCAWALGDGIGIGLNMIFDSIARRDALLERFNRPR